MDIDMLKRTSDYVCQKLCLAVYSVLRPFARFKIYSIAENSSIILNLGCGEDYRPNVIGIDLSRKAQVRWNLKYGIPLGDNTVKGIFSDHFFEHLQLTQIVMLLRDCYRVLVPGGRLRFTVPHIDPYVQAWLRQDMYFMENQISDIPQDLLKIYATPFDRISWLLLRNGEHRTMFDRASILHKVGLAGFSQVKTDDFDPSLDINPRFSSIYVEATK